MTANEILVRLGRGLNADLVDYRELKELLAAQFEAALHHRSERLAEIGAVITGLAESIEGRRRDRVELVGVLLKGQSEVSMEKALERMPEAPRRMLKAWWDQLEGLAGECKERNAQVCRLLMDQHEIMQRVLGGEADTYVPN